MDRRHDGMAAASFAGYPALPQGASSAPRDGDAAGGVAMRHAADRPLPMSACMAWTAIRPAPRATGSARRRRRTTEPCTTRAGRPMAAARSPTERARRS